ncbi:FG-GAP-like repeat-containing protein [Psychroserpens sp.]|uniref:FG-GAP-like repeat-containing protein n=1 Tax=Psychroserpens sp. TaxID=2020870 RepID=UPI001B05EE43|nr:FG-GAP-like repeat-containing protein [Psychroserpens sp.]MBO6605594.1 VCBS repeat-containing protein [Psychroserpens sp.]MBO6653597.1 VCBS repeat-containing protein [Psychroserpens sp.]MBO6681918.1 VCBS repeat-containing protein [Psychroserpens sp.]MBO6748968.1 VCBS repeat-containing protein [Psychroserpens sp.]MBO6915487.1 VCBS repeat-containing protein [Psychroserpens sp.]
MTLRLFFALFFCSSFLSINAQIDFVNNAFGLGINYSTGLPYLGSGVSFVDFDNDGWDDLSFASGNGQNLRFYKNNAGTFTSVALIGPVMHETKQINWVDIDNDGDKDLFVGSATSGNKLYENLGNLNFQDITSTSGFPLVNIYTNGACWADYDNDGYLDVFLSSKGATTDIIIPNFLYRNNGDGTFSDVSAAAGIDADSHQTFCSVWIDINNDGWQDIYTSTDKAYNLNQMYRNNGDGTFTEIGFASGTNLAFNAMTTTVGDYNNDGWIDIYVTNGGNTALLVNNGDETFTDMAVLTGCEHGGFTWGAVFMDADLDADLDLYVSSSLYNLPSINTSVFYEKLNTGAYQIPNNIGFIGDEKQSYCNAIGDINNDGYPDLVVTNGNYQTVDVWQNMSSTSNHWLKVSLEGTTSNRDGIGAYIEISVNGEQQYRQVQCGEGYLTQNSSTEFFGVGQNTTIDYLKVTWPSGAVDMLNNIPADQLINVVENSSSLSVSEFDQNELRFYPNPVNDILNIASEIELSEIKLYNVLQQEVMRVDAGELNTIDFSSLNSGVYFLHVLSDSEATVVRKIIKN